MAVFRRRRTTTVFHWIQGESCSEQAVAHLFARHDDSRERQVAPLVSRSEEFKPAARKEEALVWNPLSTLLQ